MEVYIYLACLVAMTAWTWYMDYKCYKTRVGDRDDELLGDEGKGE